MLCQLSHALPAIEAWDAQLRLTDVSLGETLQNHRSFPSEKWRTHGRNPISQTHPEEWCGMQVSEAFVATWYRSHWVTTIEPRDFRHFQHQLSRSISLRIDWLLVSCLIQQISTDVCHILVGGAGAGWLNHQLAWFSVWMFLASRSPSRSWSREASQVGFLQHGRCTAVSPLLLMDVWGAKI